MFGRVLLLHGAVAAGSCCAEFQGVAEQGADAALKIVSVLVGVPLPLMVVGVSITCGFDASVFCSLGRVFPLLFRN